MCQPDIPSTGGKIRCPSQSLETQEREKGNYNVGKGRVPWGVWMLQEVMMGWIQTPPSGPSEEVSNSKTYRAQGSLGGGDWGGQGSVLCRFLLTASSAPLRKAKQLTKLPVTTSPLKEQQPGSFRVSQAGVAGQHPPVRAWALSRGHLGSSHLSSAAQNREQKGGKDGQERDGL